MRGLVSPPERAYSRDKSEPVRRQDKDKDGRKKPECSLGQMRSNDSTKELVQSLDEPLREVLRSRRNLLHLSGCKLSKYDQAECNDPTDQHGICNWEVEGTRNFYWLG